MKRIMFPIMILFFTVSALSAGDSFINRENDGIRFYLEAEFGALDVLYHTLRIGDASTSSTFDYVREGGQDIFYPFGRISAGMTLKETHRILFTYQPLEVVTETVFKEDRTIDGVTFAANTAMEISYGFPFYRITYGYDFLKGSGRDLGAGTALQIRNASIVFKELEGNQMTVSQNIGPVPALYFFGRYDFDGGAFLSSEITGLYASSAIINGADYEFEGSILDASVRGGYKLNRGCEIFINARFFGGSAAGTSSDDDPYWTDSQNPSTENYLATTTVTLGMSIR